MRVVFLLILWMISFDSHAKTAVTSFNKDRDIYSVIDRTIRPHFAEFMKYCELSIYAERCARNAKLILSIRYRNIVDPTDPDIVGLCTIYDNFREIRLKKNLYPPHSLEFKMLVWHELGHCLMDLRHIEGRLHIMNPSMMEKSVMVERWDSLIEDLIYGKPILSK